LRDAAADSALSRFGAGWQWLTGVSLAARAPQVTVLVTMSVPLCENIFNT
jgi:hypothetical protein